MPPARIDLRSRTFRRAARGFDPGDVQAFLEVIASDYDQAHAERERVREAVAAVSGELETLRDTERTLMRMLSGAAQEAEAQTVAAHADAQRILAEAHAQAGALIGAHDDWCRQVDAEIANMRRKQQRAHAGLTALIAELELGGEAPREGVRTAGTDAGPLAPTQPEPVYAPGEVPLAGAATPATNHDPAPDRDPAASETASELSPTSRLDEPFDLEEFEQVVSPVRQHGKAARWASVGAVFATLTCVAVLAWPGVGEAPVGAAASSEHEARVVTTPAQVVDVAAPERVQADPLVVRLSATRDCWVRLTVDGRPESHLLAAGDHLARGANRAIELRVGDAAALSVTVNGSPVGPLGRDGQVVNRRFEANAPIQ